MRLRSMVVLMMLMLTGLSLGQSKYALELFTGYTMSAFENQESAAGAYLLGVQMNYKVNPRVEAGVEFNMVPSGFQFEGSEQGFDLEQKYRQTVFGVFAKYYLTQKANKIYAKAGVGMFTGDLEQKVSYQGESDTDTYKMEGGIGFSLGVGITVMQDYFVEGVYNIVSRKLKDAEGDKAGMNSWAIRTGYRFEL